MAEKTLTTDKDAYVDEASPDTELGGGANLYVTSQGGPLGDGDRRVLVSFDVKGDLPSDAAEVTDAVLRLTPEATSTLDRDLRCEEITGSWGETTVTWNNQPSIDTDHGLESSADDPHEWTVTGSVQDAFDNDNRAELRVKDDAEGSPDGPQQEYSSREGEGQTPELVVTFKKSGTGDLSSTIDVSNNQFADLDSPLHVREAAVRHETFVAVDTVDPDGSAVGPVDMAWDAGRGVFWMLVSIDGNVRKVDRHGNVLEKMANQDPDTHDNPIDANGIAYDGTDLWLVSSGGELARWSIDADGASLTHQESFSVQGTDGAAWDGSNPWGLDTFDEELVEWDSADGSQVQKKDVSGLNGDPEGVAFVDGDSNFRILEEVSDTDVQIVERDSSLNQKNSIDHPAPPTAPSGVAFMHRDADQDVVVGDWDNDRFHRIQTFDIGGTVEVGKEFGTADLSSSVTPGNVSEHADLDSLVAVGAQAHLSTQVTPKENSEADLDASLSHREAGTSDLNSTIEPGTTQVSSKGRAQGRVDPGELFGSEDVEEISAQAGSSITWTQDPGATDETTVTARRVVELVEAQAGKTFPRERTSHEDRDPDHSELARGDAVLYALPGDDFKPGDTVDWNGRTWEVVGGLGWERAGGEKVYQEIGLRRLASDHLARATATVELEDDVDLLSWVDVNVP